MLTWRDASPAEPAARALWDEYQALVAERLGPGFVPTPEIFATDEAFSAFLIGELDGAPVACGGVVLHGGGTVAELKRMFVTAGARGQGIGASLLRGLEHTARRLGASRVELLTTEVLREARALYASAGYVEREVREVEGRRDLILGKSLE